MGCLHRHSRRADFGDEQRFQPLRLVSVSSVQYQLDCFCSTRQVHQIAVSTVCIHRDDAAGFVAHAFLRPFFAAHAGLDNMKQVFKPVPGAPEIGGFNSECSISGHRIADENIDHPKNFRSSSDAERFCETLTAKPLSAATFKACANALLVRYGALLIYEDPSLTGPQSTFSLHTRYGPAQITPVDGWVLFGFLEPGTQSLPWGMASNRPGSCNLHGSPAKLRDLLVELAERLSKCCTTELAVKTEHTIELLPPEVMKSCAGFYVGCYCRSEGDDFTSPYARYSDYFQKREKADGWLSKAVANGSI